MEKPKRALTQEELHILYGPESEEVREAINEILQRLANNIRKMIAEVPEKKE